MNTLKTVVIIVLLAAVAYGVYVSLTRSPREYVNGDGGLAPVWAPQSQAPGNTGPLVQLPGSSTGPAPQNQPPNGNPFSGLGSFPFSAGSSGSGGAAASGSQFRGVSGGSGSDAPGNPAANQGVSPTAGIAPPQPGGNIGAQLAGGGASRSPGGDQSRSPVVLSPPPDRVWQSAGLAQPPPGFPAIADGSGQPSAPRSDASGSRNAPAGPDGADEQLEADVLQKFQLFLQPVQRMIQAGQLDEALVALSRIYHNPALPPALARQLTPMLDSLAGTVIYSRQHLLEPPYRVREGETLESIAQQYNVPWQLLARINGIEDPQRLVPGQTLKVVRGPFSAVVNLDRYELTLKLGERYAGRFPIGIGRDSPRLEGTYTVRDKLVNPVYYGPDGFRAEGGDANNPLGRFLLDLGDQVGIHGTNDVRWVGRDDGRGAICLGDRDIDDLFGILSIGSRVVIQR